MASGLFVSGRGTAEGPALVERGSLLDTAFPWCHGKERTSRSGGSALEWGSRGDDTTTEKQRAIKEATAEMERLSASIQKAEADAATLAKEIAGLDEDISVWEGDKKAATEVRELENADYLTTHKVTQGRVFRVFQTFAPAVRPLSCEYEFAIQSNRRGELRCCSVAQDYSESVDALERAIAVLKKQAYDRKQGESLAQVAQLQLIPEHAKKVIGAFLAQGDELGSQDLDVTAPEANAYEFQ